MIVSNFFRRHLILAFVLFCVFFLLSFGRAFSFPDMAFAIINLKNKDITTPPTLKVSAYQVNKGSVLNLNPPMLVEPNVDGSVVMDKVVHVHYGEYGSGFSRYSAEDGVLKIADQNDPDDYCFVNYHADDQGGYSYSTVSYNYGKNFTCTVIGPKNQIPAIQVTYTHTNAGEVAPTMESTPIITVTSGAGGVTYHEGRLITITSGTLSGYNFTDSYKVLSAPKEEYFQFDKHYLQHFNLAFQPYKISDPSQSTNDPLFYVIPNADVTIQDGEVAGGLISLQNKSNGAWHNARTQFIYSGDAKTLTATQTVVKSLNKSSDGKGLVNSWSKRTSAPIDTSKQDVKIDPTKFNIGNVSLAAYFISQKSSQTTYANGLQQIGIKVTLFDKPGHAVALDDSTVIGADGKFTLGDLYKHIFFVQCDDGQQCQQYTPIRGVFSGDAYSAVMDQPGPYANKGLALRKGYKIMRGAASEKLFFYSTTQPFKIHYIAPMLCVDKSSNSGGNDFACTQISDNVLTINSLGQFSPSFKPSFVTLSKDTLTFNGQVLASYDQTHIPLTYNVNSYAYTDLLKYPLMIAAPLYIPEAKDFLNEAGNNTELFYDGAEFTDQKYATLHVTDQYGNCYFGRVSRP